MAPVRDRDQSGEARAAAVGPPLAVRSLPDNVAVVRSSLGGTQPANLPSYAPQDHATVDALAGTVAAGGAVSACATSRAPVRVPETGDRLPRVDAVGAGRRGAHRLPALEDLRPGDALGWARPVELRRQVAGAGRILRRRRAPVLALLGAEFPHQTWLGLEGVRHASPVGGRAGLGPDDAAAVVAARLHTRRCRARRRRDEIKPLPGRWRGS